MGGISLGKIKFTQTDCKNLNQALFNYDYENHEQNRDMPFTEDENDINQLQDLLQSMGISKELCNTIDGLKWLKENLNVNNINYQKTMDLIKKLLRN